MSRINKLLLIFLIAVGGIFFIPTVSIAKADYNNSNLKDEPVNIKSENTLDNGASNWHENDSSMLVKPNINCDPKMLVPGNPDIDPKFLVTELVQVKKR